MKKNKQEKQRTLFYRVLTLITRKPILQNIRILFYFYDSVVLKLVKKPKKVQTGKKELLIVFTLPLGDCVIFLGGIESLRKIYPSEKYRISIACQKGYEELFAPHFDCVIPLEYTKASVDPVYRASMWKVLRGKYYDVVLDPIGCEECSPNVFTVNAVCATQKIGVFSDSDKKVQCPEWMRRGIYNQILQNKCKNLHKVKYYAWFWSELGDKECEPQLAKLPKLEFRRKLPDRYFVVFPSASLQMKQWPVERFAEVTKRIYKKMGYPLVVCGTGRDALVIEEFLKQIPDVPVYNFLGSTTVSEFIEILGRAELLLTNDTSAYHIGVAKRRKVCIVTGRSAYDTYINYQDIECDKQKLSVVCHKGICYNCNDVCRFLKGETYPCVSENTVEDVWCAVEKLLGDEDMG